MITLTCWSHVVVTFRQRSYTRHDNINMLVTCCRGFPTEVVHARHDNINMLVTSCHDFHKTRQHVTNMLMLSCLVYDFCRKDTTAYDQHVNVIMSRVPLLSKIHDSTRDMIISTCWSHAVMTFRQKSHTRHDNITMLVTCCRDFPIEVVHETWYDLCRKVTTTCDQHVNVIMSRVRLLSESHDSM
jgi:small nuclear ribonucleoprotein (snRNP)-like protein